MSKRRKQPARLGPRDAAVGILLSFLCSCSGSPTTTPVVGTPVDAATAGSIEVEVTYDGAVPVARAVDMKTVPGCAAAHPQGVFDESYSVSDGKLANAVVWIKSGLENWVFSTPSDPVLIDQVGCLYKPRVSAAMVGQTVRFKNSDNEAHNVHGRPSILSAWNFILSRPGATRELTFEKPEAGVAIGCDIHPWMSGYISVVANPYFGVTANDGSVRLKNVPPGNYVIGVWHEKLGTREEKVVVEPRGSAKLQLRFGQA